MQFYQLGQDRNGRTVKVRLIKANSVDEAINQYVTQFPDANPPEENVVHLNTFSRRPN